ncbi:MAG: hypothetical protein PVI26_12915, partial [Chitinispirillia bacterium]
NWFQLWVVLFLFGCTKHTVTGSLPAVKNITQFSATITWTTQKAVKGRILLKDDQGRDKTASEKKRGTFHSITLTGLLPEKVYTYSINTIADTHFTFRTAPKTGSPFRFCIINSDDSSFKKIEQFYPDFIIPRNSINILQNNKLLYITSQIPIIYGPAKFNWSNASIWIDSERDISLINNRLKIVISDHSQITHKKNNRDDSPVVFYTSTDTVFIDTNSSSVSTGSKSVCVEVQGDEIKAGFGEDCDKLNFLIRKGTMTFEKTCILCRRLAEKKYYGKSIEYYQRFILENPSQKLHDDALYQIAFIYDKYLLDFKKAITSYAHLLSSFPQSQLSQVAQIRLNYLNSHSDYNFKPLTVFEKHKHIYNNKKDKQSLDAVEKLLEDYVNCSIGNEIILWLGTQYSAIDWKKSIDILKKLTLDSIPEKVFYDAAFKIGTILYNAEKYKKSEEYHRHLLKKFPDKSSVLQIKIIRSIRNQKREIIFICSIFFIAGVTLISFLIKPVGFSLNYMKSVFFAGCVYGLTAIIITGLFYDSIKQTIPFTLTTAILMIAINFVSRQFLNKLNILNITKITTIITTGIITLLLTFAVLYISLKRFHYLFVFERMFQ